MSHLTGNAGVSWELDQKPAHLERVFACTQVGDWGHSWNTTPGHAPEDETALRGPALLQQAYTLKARRRLSVRGPKSIEMAPNPALCMACQIRACV